mgnify:CR=1 FL=1
MGSIAENIMRVRKTLPDGVELVCVSKYFPVESIREAYNAGERMFGESRVQELTAKAAALPDDIKWHFIGHLQTNKVRQVVEIADMIQSVDSARLLDAIERVAATSGKIQKCLIEVHVAKEETKTGFSPHDFAVFMRQTDWIRYPHIRICGLMGMASNTDDIGRIRKDFATLKALANLSALRNLSMGMSGDYLIAVEEGSTMVRIGSLIFS